MVQRQGPATLIHAILTCVTCLWGIVWIATALNAPPFRCTACGTECAPQDQHSKLTLVFLVCVLAALCMLATWLG